MNIIRQLRKHAGVTQQELARRAGTSQSTIAAYESGSKSPTLRTLQRLAHALNLELHYDVSSRLTREDDRSLAYHRAVVDKLERDPNKVTELARFNLSKLRRIHPGASELFDRWEDWLRLSPDTLVQLLQSPDEVARDMRQVSPFAGVLTPPERAQVLRQFRRDRAA